MNVLLFIADQCNFSCPYCYNRQPRTKTLADLDLLWKFVDDMHAKT
nr:MAG TPA: Radical SAM superfamily [Caudoviricetes sp.]